MPGVLPRKIQPGKPVGTRHTRIFSGQHLDRRVAINAKRLVSLSTRRLVTREDIANASRISGIDSDRLLGYLRRRRIPVKQE